MAYSIGILLALAVAAFGRFAGFDRSRAYYPTILIVTASYYTLFGAMAGSSQAVWQDSIVVGLFTSAALLAFRTTLWIAVAAFAAHGALDAIHHLIILSPGVPEWWPPFCAFFDVTAAGCLALSLLRFPERANARVPFGSM